jgi:hypothetical protein
MANGIVAPPSSADELIERFADDLTDWIRCNRDQAHVHSDETPDTPRDLAFWNGVTDELHVEVEETVRRVLDSVGGPVPAGLGRRDLGSKRPALAVVS